MKKMFLFFVLALLVPASSAWAQRSPGTVQFEVATGQWHFMSQDGRTDTAAGVLPFVGAPTGTCTSMQLAINTSNGFLYSCNGGTWLLAGGGAGSVTHTGNLTLNSLVLGNGVADAKIDTACVTNGTGALSGCTSISTTGSLSTGSGASAAGATATGGFACVEAASTGWTPTAGQDYLRCDSTLHGIVVSSNGAAEVVPGDVATGRTNVYGAFLQDFSAATMEIPEAAGFTANMDSTIGLDTTANAVHLWTNGADSINAAFAAAPAGTKCVQTSGTNGLLSEAAGACGGTAFSGIATGTNTTATMTLGAGATLNGATTGIFDMSPLTTANNFKIPVIAGGAPTANGAITYDSTANELKTSVSAATNIIPTVTGTTNPTSGRAAFWGANGTLAAGSGSAYIAGASGSISLSHNGNDIFAIGRASLIGTNDHYIQGQPAVSTGYTLVEDAGQTGLGFTTSGPRPIVIAPNRVISARYPSGGGHVNVEGTAPTNVASSAATYYDSTQHESYSATAGSANFGMNNRTQPGAINSGDLTAAVTTATLCAAAAGACNVAGQYEVHFNFIETGTACATPGAGGVTFLLTWTDANGTAHSAVSLGMDDASAINSVSQTFHFQTALATAWASGQFTLSSNGSIIQYATGYTACGVGTGTYRVQASAVRLQ